MQIDAHVDWREEIGGERLGLSSTMRRASEMPWVERIVQVGARGVGSVRGADHRDAPAWGVRLFPARAVHEHGIGAVLEAVPEGAEVLLTLDCDGLDPGIMPAVIGPLPGGLGYWQVAGLIEGISARARIACFDVVELMPWRDIGGLGALSAARLTALAIGHIARAAR